MFFILSKTIGIMLLPINFLLLAGLVGVSLMPSRLAKAGRRIVAVSLILLAVCAFSPLGTILLDPLETRFPPWDARRGPPDGILVLGGSVDGAMSAARGVPVIRSAADRIVAAVALARKYPGARVVFSGGSGSLIAGEPPEADYAAKIFVELGIEPSRLTIERNSRNTLENAEFSKALVKPTVGERWLLVTSAVHMPRAIGLFRKVGFPVEPYPVDWRTSGALTLFSFGPFAAEGLVRTDLAAREWIGLVAYRLTGKIDHLLPGPTQD